MEKKTLKELLTKIVFYDVDTQYDFMKKSGALYVRGAEELIPNIEKLTKYARRNGWSIVGSVDRHFSSDAELSRNGGPFPDHCMDGSHGQQKISETNPLCAVYIENKQMESSELENLISNKREVFFEKQHYDVFTNPNAKKILEHSKYVVVYGVATDYCVKAAVIGMLELGKKVFVVKDAISAVTQETGEAAIAEMKAAGALFVTTEDVLKGVVEKSI